MRQVVARSAAFFDQFCAQVFTDGSQSSEEHAA
jgi:hypothetical protein